MRKPKERVFTVRLGPEDDEKLERLAAETRRSQGQVVRELLHSAKASEMLRPTRVVMLQESARGAPPIAPLFSEGRDETLARLWSRLVTQPQDSSKESLLEAAKAARGLAEHYERLAEAKD